MSQFQFLQEQNQRGQHTPGENMGIGSGNGNCVSVGMGDKKQDWFACLNNLVTHACVRDGSWK